MAILPFSVRAADGKLGSMSETDNTIPTTMKAIGQDVLGGPEVLHEVELPVPQPGPSEILVRVRATALNPTDWKHRAVEGMFLPEPPFVLGWDVSGEVAAIGFGVTLFEPGDEVFGMLPYPYGRGAAAEYVTAPARAFARKPANLDHTHAGAIPLAALTAYQALVDTANVQAGQRVLIHAASGGVGHFAVQIAKSLGAHVTATASAANHDFLRTLGADEVLDYRTTDFAETVRNIDMVLDPIDSPHALRSLRTLNPGGIVVSIRATGTDELYAEAEKLGVRAIAMLVEADHAGMEAIRELAESGALRPTLAGVFPLADAAKAHALGDTGRTVGKLVLTVE
ncbi:NADPH:quinone reductase [Nocardia seriolae]|uniref:NADPH:quinone reductase n=2 Tax=Nocardia seriolae TaxID=37332 RepID=A0ABC8AUA5_9NOCA|nr:NADPH:quinone reductase [Nocardia seriolae]GAM49742.1 zinc-binding oxidoreductase [Nocardia seriolae]GAP31694.1 zinc-binding oxidoreductase [Nocardia seriolae]